MTKRKRGLGRGLDALLGDLESTPVAPEAAGGSETLRDLPVEQLRRGRYQPRRDMDPQALDELAASIRHQGVMQPIVVRALPGQEGFEIVAGERRWRAAQLAGLARIPALVRDIDDEAAIAMALIENIQREDLNPLEEAIALDRLHREFELTHQQTAEAVGKSRTAVTNLLRLLELTDEVKTLLEHGDLEMGHARALLALPPERQGEVAGQVVAGGLSVRQTEALVRERKAPTKPAAAQAAPAPDVERLQRGLADRLGARVQVVESKGGRGRLVIHYHSLDELAGIIDHLGVDL